MAWEWQTKPTKPAAPPRPDVTLALYTNSGGGQDMMLTVRLPDWTPERVDLAVGTGDHAGKIAFRPGEGARLRKAAGAGPSRYARFRRPVDAPVDVYPAVGCEFTRDGDLLIVTLPDWTIPRKLMERTKKAPAPASAPVQRSQPVAVTNPEVNTLPWPAIKEMASKDRVVVADHADLARWNRSRAARGLSQIAVAA